MNEDRQKLWDEYTGVKPAYIAWPWLKYTRYGKAEFILHSLQKLGEDITKIKVLDYGSGVGDYGFVFGRAGADVTFFDKQEQLDFSKYRVEKEPIQAHFLQFPEDNPIIDVDLVIFGEVLEHIENPLQTVTDYFNKKIKYLYTSSYPYRSDNPNDDYWKHHGDECLPVVVMQKPCRELLENNYTYEKYDGNARLWILK